MKIVIDIDDDLYDYIRNNHVVLSVRDARKVKKAIANGAPLPKRYGRLIDADELLKEKRCFEDFDGDTFNIIHEETVINAPTIIGADKERE